MSPTTMPSGPDLTSKRNTDSRVGLPSSDKHLAAISSFMRALYPRATLK